MPERTRRPRRRVAATRSTDFTSEAEARQAVAAFRAQFATAELAEADPRWPALRTRLARWILKSWRALGAIDPAGRAFEATSVYLKAPHYLPPEPPGGWD